MAIAHAVNEAIRNLFELDIHIIRITAISGKQTFRALISTNGN